MVTAVAGPLVQLKIEATYTAANGDTITMESTDYVVDYTASPPVGAGTFEMVEGTGRFEHVIGWGEWGAVYGETRTVWAIQDARFGPPLCYPHLVDRGWIAYPSTNGTIVVHDFYQLRRVVEIQSAAELNAMALSPDGAFLAAGCRDGTALIWEIDARRLARPPLVGHLSGVVKVQFSLDSRTLVTCSDDGTARMWNVATGQEMVSELPMNPLLRHHLWLHPLLDDGDTILEAAGPDQLRRKQHTQKALSTGT